MEEVGAIREEDCVRIDAHHHVWDLAVRDQPWTAGFPVLHRSFDLAELGALLTAHDFDASIVVQTVCVAEETPELLALAAQHPTLIGVVGWVDLTAADVAERIDQLRALRGGDRLVGIRHQVQQEPDPRWLCRPDVRRGLTAVAEAGLVYDLLVVPDQLPAAAETVRALPQLQFVLDHGGKPRVARGELVRWRQWIAALATAPNVAVKLSGLATEADPQTWTTAQLRPYTEALLDSFGASRVMFGSDWPVCLIAGSYDRIVRAGLELTEYLDASERAAIFGDTAARWYELSR